MANTKIKIDKRRATKEGTYPLKISVGYGTGLYLSTDIYIREEDWDERTMLCIGKQARQINSALQSILARVRNRMLELVERGMIKRLTTSQIRQMLENMELEKPTENKQTFLDFFERVRDSKRGEGNYGTKGTYITALNCIRRFCDVEKLTFEDITKQWLREFVAFLDSERVSPNSQRQYLAKLRHVINVAYDDELITHDPFRRFIYPRHQETKKRALDFEEFRRIVRYKGKASAMKARDLFLLSFCFIGMNPRDLFNISAKDIVRGRLEYRRAKTGRLYSVKVEPEALELLPSVFEWNKDKGYRSFYANNNKHLKELRDEIGVIEPALTWYWARHSWATYAAELDIPDDIISRALGHSRGTGAAVTSTYIKNNRSKVDEANRRVIDFAFYGRR